ncbi:MAG: hypothetical protein ACREDE_04085, partial [Thermoplasmata archaeon]
LHPRVLGRPTPLGDDWMLTDYLLRAGYETVRAYDTRVVTHPKANFSSFLAQNVRWSRSNWIRLGSYLRRGPPRAVGRFYMFEVAGTYVLPLIALVTIATRVPMVTYSVDRASGGLESVGLILLFLLAPVSRELWKSLARISLTVLGTFAVGAFAGAVTRDYTGPRLRFIAYGALGATVLFVTSVYGLFTFWKRPSWGSPLPLSAPPLHPPLPLPQRRPGR